MKIFIHINSLGRGGAERAVSILSQAFAKKGEEVVVATEWESEDEYPLEKAVKRVSVGLTEADERKGRISRALIRFFRLKHCIQREKPDIVLSFCNKANFRSALSLTFCKTPLLVSVRNNPLEDYAPYKLATAWMERRADGCVFQTGDAKAFFSKRLQKKSRIIFNPLSEKYLETMPYEGKRKKEIVNVGRISAQKDQMLLLKAFTQIKDEFPDYVLKIYGDVQEEAVFLQLKDYVENSGLTDRVLFMGNSTRLPEEIREASLFVLSSAYEGMPNALIEAMSLGLPCISTDCPCGGSALLMENGTSGLLTPVGNEQQMAAAIKEVLSDSELADGMGREARKIIQKVKPEQIASEWLDYIYEIINRCAVRK